MAREQILSAMADLGLSVSAVFVPWSQSRNKDEKETDVNGKPTSRPRHSLNWRVTLKKAPHLGAPDAVLSDVLTTDYSAGIGHCPFYAKLKDKAEHRILAWEKEAIVAECECGLAVVRSAVDTLTGAPIFDRNKPIMPDTASVVASLARDSDVLDYGSFEEWARDLGYAPDSRKAEAIYRSCLEIALKLRNALGEACLSRLREACQDF